MNFCDEWYVMAKGSIYPWDSFPADLFLERAGRVRHSGSTFLRCDKPLTPRQPCPPPLFLTHYSNTILNYEEAVRKKKLVLVCPRCTHRQEAPSVKVHVMSFSSADSTEAKLRNTNLILDPTLPRKMDVLCASCSVAGPVYHQTSADKMTLTYICIACNHSWTSV